MLMAGSEVVAGIKSRLQRQAPPPPSATPLPAASGAGVPRAAVAIMLRQSDSGLELLMIKRAERSGDPWSGQIALPGGREDPSDSTLEETAIRETREETGIDLARDGVVLGVLPDLGSQSRPVAIVVRPFVATVRADVALVLSDEVAAAFWTPLETFTAPGASVESVVTVGNVDRRVRSFRYGEYVVWGMTERILQELLLVLADPSFP
jgi:8-oxo-dGTP pyrophosphatase MutT (NUDIX family)